MGPASVGTSDKIDDQSPACSNDERQTKEKMEKKASVGRQMEKNAYRHRTGWYLLVLFSGDVDNTLHMYLLKKKYAHCNTTVYLHHGITILRVTYPAGHDHGHAAYAR